MPLINKKLGKINLRKYTKALILAYKQEDEIDYNFLPNSKTILVPNMHLIVLASIEEFENLKKLINGEFS